VKSQSKKSVCVVIPAYNEAKVIHDVITHTAKTLDKEQSFSYQIVIVNDGSTDNTGLEASKTSAFVINHILNSGAGSATATGLRYAQKNNFDIAVTMDADGQHAPEDVMQGINLIKDSDTDLLIGSRLIDSSGMSKVKVLGNKGLSAVTYILFGINSTDSQSGLRVFSRKSLDTLKWKTNGYEFCSEMLWRANQAGLTIDEYPIQAIYTDYSTSKGQNNWNAINIVKSLLRRRIAEIFE